MLSLALSMLSLALGLVLGMLSLALSLVLGMLSLAFSLVLGMLSLALLPFFSQYDSVSRKGYTTISFPQALFVGVASCRSCHCGRRRFCYRFFWKVSSDFGSLLRNENNMIMQVSQKVYRVTSSISLHMSALVRKIPLQWNL